MATHSSGSSDGKSVYLQCGRQVQFLSREDSLEKEMATHSSILTWKSPWTEESGKLQSMRYQTAGHDFTFNFQYSCLGNP